jgi:hypothetical protein
MQISTTTKKSSLEIPQKTRARHRETKADTLKQLRPRGKGEQVLEKRLDQKELT